MKNFLAFCCLLLDQLCCNGQIYTPGKSFVFDAQYYQSDQKITVNETITLSITGNNWRNSQDQKEAIWNYKLNRKTKQEFTNHFSLGWTQHDTTGII